MSFKMAAELFHLFFTYYDVNRSQITSNNLESCSCLKIQNLIDAFENIFYIIQLVNVCNTN